MKFIETNILITFQVPLAMPQLNHGCNKFQYPVHIPIQVSQIHVKKTSINTSFSIYLYNWKYIFHIFVLKYVTNFMLVLVNLVFSILIIGHFILVIF